ncbi:MAG: hypothetical protein IIZ38_07075 [Sphingomonas sp.]|uniref:hypothetical protein n=1 Tax=unclassified Sphingomonas TaxID=196159 RepID=UPI0024538885|nr:MULTISPECIES: hypothetical protein [unclassified Sphingomonas]MBQ1498058.1 hypothetical protein [Sphingomonas sp.]MDH4742634.1 hypothetical protein [Sphingomonas sp. CBMAI 2297]
MTNYFPPGDWFKQSGEAALSAMREPALWRDTSIEGYSRRSRLLVVPSFQAPYAIRIDQPLGDLPEAHFVETDGMGGYDPGRVASRERGFLEGEIIAALQDHIREARLGERLVEPEPGKDDFGNPSPDAYQSVWLDGAKVIFEDRTVEGYALVSRSDGDLDAALKVLAQVFLSARGAAQR